MIYDVLAAVSGFVLNIINSWDYTGVFLLMFLESANIPIPSEVIMPFSGFLAASGVFNFGEVVLIGALGNLAGSAVSYGIGYKYGERALRFLEKWHLFNKKDLEISERMFRQYGNTTAFWSRLLPVARTFISLPAGVFKSKFWPFCLYTFAGSFLWSGFLTYLGLITGENWRILESYFRNFDIAIGGGIVLVLGWWIKRHFFY